jgi:hypothetical protein
VHEVEQNTAVLTAAQGHGYGVIAPDHAVLADGVLNFALYIFYEMETAEVGSAVGLEMNGCLVALFAFHGGLKGVNMIN